MGASEDSNLLYFKLENLTWFDIKDSADNIIPYDPQERKPVRKKPMRPYHATVQTNNNVYANAYPEQNGTIGDVNRKELAIFKIKGKLFAIQAKCPHAGGPLELADIEDFGSTYCVRCPYHGWKFNLKTGECYFPGSHGKDAKVYPIKVDKTSGELWVGFESFDQSYFKDTSF